MRNGNFRFTTKYGRYAQLNEKQDPLRRDGERLSRMPKRLQEVDVLSAYSMRGDYPSRNEGFESHQISRSLRAPVH